MDIVLNPIVSKLLDKLTDLANKNLRLISDVPREIQNLHEKLLLIQNVLNDAEQWQITEVVQQWLRKLKDVMYDADDIVDEYQITAEEKASPEQPPEEPSVVSRMLHRFRHVKSAHEIGSKISDLNQRMERILAERSQFDLRVVPDRQNVVARVRRETSPGVKPDIVGEAIEMDTRYLVDWLKAGGEKTNSNVCVVAIVGIGGIGKTTLAQKIFNDDEIKTVFQKTMWVCVSQEFIETDLLREIILSVKGSPGEAHSKAQLETIVMRLLKENKFLLVLDDVWDAQIWEDLFRKPLHVGGVGSKVLVTTRSQRVAERMKAIHIHDVDPLSLDDSWLLLCKKVTNNAEEERDTQHLKDIGMRIVEKCQGLPLAITVIGGVLCGKLSRLEWERVEHSSEWSQTGLPSGVHQALYLSYQDLPSHLRQCFIHCSLFHDNYEPYNLTLVKQWIAEGFVVKIGEENPSPEEIAFGYLDELIQRNLLRTSEEKFPTCKMHDLLRSLCHFLARGESLVITDIYKELPSTADDGSIKRRRLSIATLESQDMSIATPKYQDIKPLQHLTRHKSVRTLFLTGLTLNDEDVDNCFKNFQRLRVVDLGYTMIQSLPESVGSLLHLRYMSLAGCRELEALPESIASLRKLQFLSLYGCIKLRTLPMGVGKLCSLRALNLTEVPLDELPSEITKLEHVNELIGAVFSKVFSDSRSSCSLEEISNLRNLRELFIVNLAFTTDESQQKSKNNLNGLKTLKELVTLSLICGPSFSVSQHVGSCTGEETKRIEMIFDVALYPPTCVRKIAIDNFFGHQFPVWLMSRSISSFLPNLTSLLLQSCHSCSVLPPLGKLPNLEELDLTELYAVTSIGVEFFGLEEASTSVAHESGGSKSALSSQVLFPRLKRLCLESLLNLEKWDWVPEEEGIVAMPRLSELTVESCPELLSLPNGLNHQARLTKLSSINNTFLQTISEFPFVKDLKISGEICLDIVSDLPALKVLKVDLLKPQSRSLPGWLVHSLPHLTSLEVLLLTCESERLLYGCLQDGIDWPKISHIPVVQIRDNQGNYIIYHKHPFTFQTNIV